MSGTLLLALAAFVLKIFSLGEHVSSHGLKSHLYMLTCNFLSQSQNPLPSPRFVFKLPLWHLLSDISNLTHPNKCTVFPMANFPISANSLGI